MIILSTEFLNIQGNDSDAFPFQIFWHITFPISRFIRISSTTFEEKGEKESGNERGRVEAEREGGRKFDLSAGMEEGGGGRGGQGAAEIAPLSASDTDRL